MSSKNCPLQYAFVSCLQSLIRRDVMCIIIYMYMRIYGIHHKKHNAKQVFWRVFCFMLTHIQFQIITYAILMYILFLTT